MTNFLKFLISNNQVWYACNMFTTTLFYKEICKILSSFPLPFLSFFLFLLLSFLFFSFCLSLSLSFLSCVAFTLVYILSLTSSILFLILRWHLAKSLSCQARFEFSTLLSQPPKVWGLQVCTTNSGLVHFLV